MQNDPKNAPVVSRTAGGFASRLRINGRLAWINNRSWLIKDILAPFLATRVGLLMVGWLAQFLPLNPAFIHWDLQAKPWFITTHRLLDMWARWDSSWYLQIINDGYTVVSGQPSSQNSLAFFPLFPYLVRYLAHLVPASFRSQTWILVIGLLVSNLFLVGSLLILHKLTQLVLDEDAPARHAVWYMLIFPTSFYLSSFYSESTFLFFSLAAFYAGEKRRWAVCGVMGFLAALARPVGVLLIIPLLWLYLRSIQYQVRAIRWNIAWLVLIPAGLGLYLAAVYPLTGDLLAPLKIQSAWSRTLSTPWQTLISPTDIEPVIKPFQQVTALGSLILLVYTFWKLPNPAYGLYAGLLILPALLSGTLISYSRFVVVAFPFFISLGIIGKHRYANVLLTVIFLLLQVLLMAGWSQFYPIY